jgi:hypothetical protein
MPIVAGMGLDRNILRMAHANGHPPFPQFGEGWPHRKPGCYR